MGLRLTAGRGLFVLGAWLVLSAGTAAAQSGECEATLLVTAGNMICGDDWIDLKSGTTIELGRYGSEDKLVYSLADVHKDYNTLLLDHNLRPTRVMVGRFNSFLRVIFRSKAREFNEGELPVIRPRNRLPERSVEGNSGGRQGVQNTASASVRTHKGQGYQFQFPLMWQAREIGQVEGRFSGVELIGPDTRQGTIQVLIRTAADDKEPIPYMEFVRKNCGPGAAPPGPVPSPVSTSPVQGIVSSVVRNLNPSDRRECISAQIFVDPLISTRSPQSDQIRRPFINPLYARVLYAHASSRPSDSSIVESRIGGGDVEGYLRSLDAWNLVVSSFTFTSGVPSVPTPTLVGSWVGEGVDLQFRANGTFEEIYNYGGPTMLNDGGRYEILPDNKVVFHYRIGLKGKEKACDYSLGPNRLTVCGFNYRQR